ncbi:MAG: hypothetical protein HY548_09375 [Elusimicrobia bacterium]|nr:hypothetical protein [Elusimicrobiota bacterium]
MKTKALKRILKIEVKRELDECPDLSFLGEFTDQWQEGAIEHDGGPRDYKYFVSGNHAVYKLENWAHVPEADKQGVIRQYGSLEAAEKAYARQDYERMLDYDRGDWHMVGILAVAEVAVSFDGGKTWKLDRLTSGGLWGIESDGGEDYFQSVGKGELENLHRILAAYGFTPRQIHGTPVLEAA